MVKNFDRNIDYFWSQYWVEEVTVIIITCLISMEAPCETYTGDNRMSISIKEIIIHPFIWTVKSSLAIRFKNKWKKQWITVVKR